MYRFIKSPTLALLLTLMTAAPPYASATSGGVNSKGCHNSKSIGYHCHADRVKSGGELAGSESKYERSKRLKRECKGGVNAGACTGYTGK